MSEMRPCPFCGKTHQIVEDYYDGPLFGVDDDTCPMWVAANLDKAVRDRNETIELYNTRPIEAALEAEVERLKAARSSQEVVLNHMTACNMELLARIATLEAEPRWEIAPIDERQHEPYIYEAFDGVMYRIKPPELAHA